MQYFLEKANNQKVAFVENIKNINSIENFSSKELCIIKTNFKDLSTLKNLLKKYSNVEFWLTSENINRENVIIANHYGIKNVLPFPFDIKIVRDYLQKKHEKPITQESSITDFDWLKGLKIMIVDDNPTNIELLVETLAVYNLNITTFTEPENALKIIDSKNFDLFLLDIMMPKISGFELAQKIKDSTLNKNTPIVFISALCDAKNKITGYNLGSTAYIEKPFDISVVRSQVFNILKSKILQDKMSKTKESFLAMVAHDLKSPVNAEITALEILLSKVDNKNSEDNEIISDLLQAAKYMKNLVDNILYKYKYENNTVSLNKTLNSLNTAINDCVVEMKYLASDKNQKIIYKNKTNDEEFSFDFIEIKRVVHNLLSNAIEHAPRDSEIKVLLSENKDYLITEVSNKLKCTPPENIDQIFDKFVSFAEKSKRANSGLGLFISKKIVEAHDGKIKVETNDNNEIKFTFSLPK